MPSRRSTKSGYGGSSTPALETKIEDEKEIFDARWDRTQELVGEEHQWKRRLDSIARLIEGSAICAAIAVEEDSFLIATNKEFSRGEGTEDRDYLLINKVMSFFKGIADGNIKDEDSGREFKETFRAICSGAMAGLKFPAYVNIRLSDDDFINKVIKSANKNDFRELRDYISEDVENGHCPASRGSAFVVCVALMRDFNKVKKFIQDNKSVGKDRAEIKGFIDAIKKYNLSNIICKENLRGKVHNTEHMHAEMRILASIENKLKNDSEYRNYIGISKLCCLDCHAMIYGLNKAVDYKNTVEIRGAHNVLHPGNWNAPFNISGTTPTLKVPKVEDGERTTRSVDDERPDEPFVAAVIAAFTKVRPRPSLVKRVKGKKPAEAEETVGAKGVPEYASLSQSPEREGDKYYAEYCEYLECMVKSFKMRPKVCGKSSCNLTKLAEETKILEVGLKIYKKKAFEDVCDGIESGNPAEDLRALTRLVVRTEVDSLREFLMNPLFSGERANKHFHSVVSGLRAKKPRVANPSLA